MTVEDLSKVESDLQDLEVLKSLYKSKTLPVLTTIKGYCSFMCITFKVDSDEEQVLISNHTPEIEEEEEDYCEISVTATAVKLHIHSEAEVVQHDCKEWTTLFVECNSDETTTNFKYDINGKVGSYMRASKDINEIGVAFGSRYDSSLPTNGQVLALDFYSINQPSQFPEELKKILIYKHTLT